MAGRQRHRKDSPAPLGDVFHSDVSLIIDRASIREVTDKVTGKVSRRLSAVGSVANKIYKSGRIIPLSVQKDGIQKTVDSGRQLTAFIEHPGWMDSIMGDIKQLAAIVVEGPTLDANGNTAVTFEIASTPQGELLGQLLDSKVELGVSQRALGKQEYRALPGEGDPTDPDYEPPDDPLAPKELCVVTDIYGIFGYDFVHLDAANAGNDTRVRALSDSFIAALQPATPREDPSMKTNPTQTKPGAASGTETNPAAPPSPVNDDLTAQQKVLTDSVNALAAQVKEMATRLDTRASADGDKAKPLADAAKEMIAAVNALIADESVTAEDKNKKLQDMAVQVQSAFAQVTGTAIDPAAVAQLDSMKAATRSSSMLADALKGMLASDNKQTRAKAMLGKFGDLLDKVGGDGFSNDDRTALRTRLQDRASACETEEQVKQLVEDAISMVNLGRAKERLVQMGYTPPATPTAGQEGQPTAMIDASGDRSHLEYAAFLTDKMIESGSWAPRLDLRKGLVDGKPMDPRMKKLLDRWDERHGADLRREQELAKRAGGGKLTDATLMADFETPFTLARTVVFEAYADDIVNQITNFGTMDTERDSVAITRWKRASTNRRTFNPNAKERNEIKVPELNPIPEGKLTTEFFPIDAIARKLRALLSDEFITRAKRRPDMTGIALAARNLVDDVRRCIQADVFYTMIKAALLPSSIAFTSAQDGDGATATFQVTSRTSQVGAIAIDPADAVTIVPESLVVEVDGNVVPEWGYSNAGGGPAGAFFFSPNHPMGTISFVDASGNPLPPPTGTANVKVTAGKKAGGTSDTRFDLTAPVGTADYTFHINKLLAAVNNIGAVMPTNTGYVPDFVLQSRVLATTTSSAQAYRNQFFQGQTRQLNRVNGPVGDGNFGVISDMSHFASTVFPPNFTLIGAKDATVYRIFEPMVLRGPIESRDEYGHPNAGKEWYSYQEDALAVPIAEKLTLVTTYST